jgi:hypothetical protein
MRKSSNWVQCLLCHVHHEIYDWEQDGHEQGRRLQDLNYNSNKKQVLGCYSNWDTIHGTVDFVTELQYFQLQCFSRPGV